MVDNFIKRAGFYNLRILLSVCLIAIFFLFFFGNTAVYGADAEHIILMISDGFRWLGSKAH
jgi:hypothetical protein